MTNINDLPNIYNDPIIARKRLGTALQPFREIKESVTIDKHYAILSEIPNRRVKVKVTGLNRNFYEVEDEFLTEDRYRVDYTNGIVYFHSTLHNKTLNFEYTGEGVLLFPDSRVYYTGDNHFPNLRDKFVDIDRSILVQKNRVDEQIRKVPQPSEVLDTRIDYNGKIYRVAKDRIDAEQRKIEQAYVDAKGKKHASLKLRIDALEKSTDTRFDDINKDMVYLDTEFNLLPGKIEMKVSELRESVDGEISKLVALIEAVPDQIRLSVKELRESVDGELSKIESKIELQAGQIELKVDHEGIISAINLNKEGVRIQGKNIWLDGTTRINNGIIKNAMIDTVSATKLTAGSIDAAEVTIRSNIDATSFARFDGKGLYLRGRAITIEREDGYKSIIDGKLNFNYNVFPAHPPFMGEHVSYDGVWLKTNHAETASNLQFYTFRHEGRYLRLHMAHFMQNSAGNTSGGIIVSDSANGHTLFSTTFRNKGSGSYDASYGNRYTVDLGVPTGENRAIYVKLKTGATSRAAYARIIRIWQED